MIGFFVLLYLWSERQEVKYRLHTLNLNDLGIYIYKYTAKYTAFCKSHSYFYYQVKKMNLIKAGYEIVEIDF